MDLLSPDATWLSRGAHAADPAKVDPSFSPRGRHLAFLAGGSAPLDSSRDMTAFAHAQQHNESSSPGDPDDDSLMLGASHSSGQHNLLDELFSPAQPAGHSHLSRNDNAMHRWSAAHAPPLSAAPLSTVTLIRPARRRPSAPDGARGTTLVTPLAAAWSLLDASGASADRAALASGAAASSSLERSSRHEAQVEALFPRLPAAGAPPGAHPAAPSSPTPPFEIASPHAAAVAATPPARNPESLADTRVLLEWSEGLAALAPASDSKNNGVVAATADVGPAQVATAGTLQNRSSDLAATTIGPTSLRAWATATPAPGGDGADARIIDDERMRPLAEDAGATAAPRKAQRSLPAFLAPPALLFSHEDTTAAAARESSSSPSPSHEAESVELRDTSLRIHRPAALPSPVTPVAAARPAAAAPFTSFSREFIYVRELGHGAFSVVWEVAQRVSAAAKHAGPPARFAIKRWLKELRSLRERDEWLREMRVFLRCGPHPSLLSYYRAWQEDGYAHTQTELCPGGSYINMLRRARARDAIEAARAAATAAALPEPARGGGALRRQHSAVGFGGTGFDSLLQSFNFLSEPSPHGGSAAAGGAGSVQPGEDLATPKVAPTATALATLLPPAAPIPEAAIWTFLEAVASALAHLHAAGVAHLDVKPDNVLVARDGQLKLGDLGMATAYCAPSAAAAAAGGDGAGASRHGHSSSGLNGDAGFDTNDDDVGCNINADDLEGDSRYMAAEVRRLCSQERRDCSHMPSRARSPTHRVAAFVCSTSVCHPSTLHPQLLGSGGRRPPADIFSLGLSALELAMNEPLPLEGQPWQALRRGALPQAFLRPQPGSPTARSAALIALIRSMTARDPSRRPTAAALLRHAMMRGTPDPWTVAAANVACRTPLPVEDVVLRAMDAAASGTGSTRARGGSGFGTSGRPPASSRGIVVPSSGGPRAGVAAQGHGVRVGRSESFTSASVSPSTARRDEDSTSPPPLPSHPADFPFAFKGLPGGGSSGKQLEHSQLQYRAAVPPPRPARGSVRRRSGSGPLPLDDEDGDGDAVINTSDVAAAVVDSDAAVSAESAGDYDGSASTSSDAFGSLDAMHLRYSVQRPKWGAGDGSAASATYRSAKFLQAGPPAQLLRVLEEVDEDGDEVMTRVSSSGVDRRHRAGSPTTYPFSGISDATRDAPQEDNVCTSASRLPLAPFFSTADSLDGMEREAEDVDVAVDAHRKSGEATPWRGPPQVGAPLKRRLAGDGVSLRPVEAAEALAPCFDASAQSPAWRRAVDVPVRPWPKHRAVFRTEAAPSSQARPQLLQRPPIMVSEQIPTAYHAHGVVGDVGSGHEGAPTSAAQQPVARALEFASSTSTSAATLHALDGGSGESDTSNAAVHHQHPQQHHRRQGTTDGLAKLFQLGGAADADSAGADVVDTTSAPAPGAAIRLAPRTQLPSAPVPATPLPTAMQSPPPLVRNGGRVIVVSPRSPIVAGAAVDDASSSMARGDAQLQRRAPQQPLPFPKFNSNPTVAPSSMRPLIWPPASARKHGRHHSSSSFSAPLRPGAVSSLAGLHHGWVGGGGTGTLSSSAPTCTGHGDDDDDDDRSAAPAQRRRAGTYDADMEHAAAGQSAVDVAADVAARDPSISFPVLRDDAGGLNSWLKLSESVPQATPLRRSGVASVPLDAAQRQSQVAGAALRGALQHHPLHPLAQAVLTAAGGGDTDEEDAAMSRALVRRRGSRAQMSGAASTASASASDAVPSGPPLVPALPHMRPAVDTAGGFAHPFYTLVAVAGSDSEDDGADSPRPKRRQLCPTVRSP